MIPVEPELSSMKSFDYLIPLLSGLVGALIGGFVSYINTKLTVRSKRTEEKKNEIYKKLNEFYGPLMQLRLKSNILYRKFSERLKQEDPDFKTLIYLLKGNDLLGNDKIILDEIIRIGNETAKLIHDKAGLIDDDNLRYNVFPKATTHFLIIDLAYKKALVEDSDKFVDSTFPRDLDTLIRERIKSLQQELTELK